MKIYFMELTKLSPTVMSTVLKLVEETGELSREVQNFNPHGEGEGSLKNLIGELMDVAQVTATLTFVLEHSHSHNNPNELVWLEKALSLHISKLKKKGYLQEDGGGDAGISLKDGRLVLALPRLDIFPDITKTFLKISEEAGELVQIIGKKSGLSGETKNLIREDEKNTELLLALLDIAQCCVTMLYILADQYGVDVKEVLMKHEKKLREHGYL